LLIHRRKLLDPVMVVFWRVLHLVLSDDHFVVKGKVMMLHFVLVIRGSLHEVA
jgi:hypothetical protein